jgi:hypothetical protein
MKRLLINQPGRHGDIIICLPIAHYYSQFYQIDWLCPSQYHSNFRNINYCRPVDRPDGEYARTLHLEFGLEKYSEVHKWWEKRRENNESFVKAKYFLAGVPISYRRNLVWNRSFGREAGLFLRVANTQPYILCHESTHDGSHVKMDFPNKVEFREFEDYNIFDWYQVIMSAKEIHCIDSSLCNFVEVLPYKGRKVYYKTARNAWNWNNTLISNDWEVVEWKNAGVEI